MGKQTGLTLFREADGQSDGSEQESHPGVRGYWSEKGRASFPELLEALKS